MSDATEPTTSAAGDTGRWRLGLLAVLMGLAALLVAFVLVVWKWRDPTGLAALGVVASPIASMVAAYFGIQVSASAAKGAQDQVTLVQQRMSDVERSRALAFHDLGVLKGALTADQERTVSSRLRSPDSP
jgi:predicted carbohydrate-binding protein with CBM5 and CBM33 domain